VALPSSRCRSVLKSVLTQLWCNPEGVSQPRFSLRRAHIVIERWPGRSEGTPHHTNDLAGSLGLPCERGARRELTDEGEHQRPTEDLRVLRSGEAVVQSVDESIDPSGNKFWMSVTKMSLRDNKGELALVSTTHDITARKKVEEQLAKHAEELREKNAQLEMDLEIARELQNALLPQQFSRFPSFASPEESALRFHHFFSPSSAVGVIFSRSFRSPTPSRECLFVM
jgi:hypothetical protein